MRSRRHCRINTLKSGRIRKDNAWAPRLLCEFAQAAGRSRCALKESFEAQNVRQGHKRSIVALAHKMLRTMYAMLSQHTHYADKTVDYAALMVARYAPRWLLGYLATWLLGYLATWLPGYLARDAGQVRVRSSTGLICDWLALAIGRRWGQAVARPQVRFFQGHIWGVTDYLVKAYQLRVGALRIAGYLPPRDSTLQQGNFFG